MFSIHVKECVKFYSYKGMLHLLFSTNTHTHTHDTPSLQSSHVNVCTQYISVQQHPIEISAIEQNPNH